VALEPERLRQLARQLEDIAAELSDMRERERRQASRVLGIETTAKENRRQIDLLLKSHITDKLTEEDWATLGAIIQSRQLRGAAVKFVARWATYITATVAVAEFLSHKISFADLMKMLGKLQQ
jgi:hypothetical protein